MIFNIFKRGPEAPKISKEQAKRWVEQEITGVFRDDDRIQIADCIPNAVEKAIKINTEKGYNLSDEELQRVVTLTAMYHADHRGGPSLEPATALELVKRAFAEKKQ